jgi:hypothetical protein
MKAIRKQNAYSKHRRLPSLLMILGLACSPAWSQKRDRSIEVEVIDLTTSGCSPNKLSRPHGKVYLIVQNYTQKDDVAVHIEDESGKVYDAKQWRHRELSWGTMLPSTPGKYFVVVDNSQKWRCEIEIK